MIMWAYIGSKQNKFGTKWRGTYSQINYDPGHMQEDTLSRGTETETHTHVPSLLAHLILTKVVLNSLYLYGLL